MNFFASSQRKQAARSYEVSFFSALWMVSSESWKRGCPKKRAQWCRTFLKGLWLLSTLILAPFVILLHKILTVEGGSKVPFKSYQILWEELSGPNCLNSQII